MSATVSHHILMCQQNLLAKRIKATHVCFTIRSQHLNKAVTAMAMASTVSPNGGAELIARLQKFALSSHVYNNIVKTERGFTPLPQIESSPAIQIRRRDAPNPDKCIGIGRNGARELRSAERRGTDGGRKKRGTDVGQENSKQTHPQDTHVSQSTETPAKLVYNVSAKDQLFWCLMMIVRSWEEADIPDKGERFMVEASEKTTLTEMLMKSESIPWKELKLAKSTVCNELGASINLNRKISLDVLRALAFLHEKNIAYMWGKGCCVRINGARSLGASDQKWHVIVRSRSGCSLATDDHAKTLMDRVDSGEVYIVEDPNRPLSAVSAYKIGELQELANKLGVCVNREGSEKAKLKKDLYQDIVTAIHKID